MTTETAKFTEALATFSPADAAIEAMRDEFMGLRTNGVADRKALAAVHDARMAVRAHRVAIEKKRVELKADALEFGRKVDGEAKRLTALISPIEDHLTEQEEAVLSIERAEKARKENELAAKRKARLDAMVAAASAVGWPVAPSALEAMDDAVFDEMLKGKREAHEAAQKAEQERRAELARLQAEESERRRVEDEQRAKERALLDAQRAEQAAAQAKIDAERADVDAERRKVEEAQREQARAVELAAAKKKAAEDALARAAADKAAKEKRDAAKLARRPIIEQVRAFADMLDALDVPLSIREYAGEPLTDCVEAIREVASRLEAQ